MCWHATCYVSLLCDTAGVQLGSTASRAKGKQHSHLQHTHAESPGPDPPQCPLSAAAYPSLAVLSAPFILLHTQVLALPDDMLIKHHALYEDYKNVTHWPKHLLVHYHFHDEGDVDFNKGLYVLMVTGEPESNWHIAQPLYTLVCVRGVCTTA